MEMENSKKIASDQTVIIEDKTLARLSDGFTQFPNFILKRKDLTPGAKITYGLLLSYAWQKSFCFPAQERLAEDSGYSVRQVQRSLVELRTKNLVSWKQQGLNRPNIYYIKPIFKDNEAGSDNMSLQDTTPMSLQDTTPMSYKEYTVNNTQNVNVPFKTTERKREPVKQAPNGKNGGYRVDFAKLNDTEADLFVRIIGVCQDRENGANYLNVIRNYPESVVEMVISETRQAGREGRIKKTAGAYFMDTLKRITDAREQAKSL